MEVLSVQHQDQAEDLPKLCDVHPTIEAAARGAFNMLTSDLTSLVPPQFSPWLQVRKLAPFIYLSIYLSIYTALNAGGWQRATSPSCQSSTQRTSGESYKSFGLTPSPINSYPQAAIKTAWRPSSCEGDEDGLGPSWGESRTTSLAQPFTGHLKESARGEDQETRGAELWRQSSRPCNTLGVPSRSWPRTDRRGDSS